MRYFRPAAAMCAVLIGAMPVAAFAQANHNTARSNKNTVAAPAEETAPEPGTGDERPAGAPEPDGSAPPVVKANHNTARSNKNTVAAPAGDVAADVGNGGEPNARKKGYEYYQAQSDSAAVAVAPDGSAQPAGDQNPANVTVPKQTQGATFGEKVNAGLQAAGGAIGQGAAAQAPAEVCKTQTARGSGSTTTASGKPTAAGEVRTASGKPDECPGLVR
jgi:hypothetical protein